VILPPNLVTIPNIIGRAAKTASPKAPKTVKFLSTLLIQYLEV